MRTKRRVIARERDPRVLERKVYVGGLGEKGNSDDILLAFQRFGPVNKVWLSRRPAGFAFVIFKDGHNALEAVRALNGT